MGIYRYAIFDLDGTLLDTAQDLADSVNHALELSQYPLRSLDEIKSFVGNGVANLVSLAVPEGTSEPNIGKVLSDFRLHYASNMDNLTKPFPGIIPLLQQLKDAAITVSISSNKFQEGVELLCEKHFPNLYVAAFGEREGIARKPDPAIVYTALQVLDAKPKETLYIGDSEVDAQTAKNAGIDFVGVSWGLRPAQLLRANGALEVVESPHQLAALFGL